MNRLRLNYEKEIVPALAKELGVNNKLAVPRVEKVIVNAGIGGLGKDKEQREAFMQDLAQITGQRPSIRPAKLSVAGFNIRAGMPVGLKITLRGTRMYAFLDKLFSVVLPRIRDFRGLSLKGFDKFGNYSLGISDHSVFPELEGSKIAGARGLEVTIVTDSKNVKHSKQLLKLMGMPLEKGQEDERGKK